jgi:PAS domain S-box-containing protein
MNLPDSEGQPIGPSPAPGNPGPAATPARPEEEFPLPMGWLSGGQAVLSSDGAIVEINDSMANWLAGARCDLAGKLFWPLLWERFPEWEKVAQDHLSRRQAFDSFALQAAREGFPRDYHLELARHGETVFLRIESALPGLSDLEDSPWDEHLRAEEARRGMYMRLLRAEAQLDNMVRRWPGVIFNQRPDGSFSFVSPGIEAVTGISADKWRAQGPLFWRVVHEADAEELQQQYRRLSPASRTFHGSYRVRHSDSGGVTYVMEHREAVFSASGLLLGYEGVWLDVTRQTIAERRLSSAAWKETLAVLTMGLAHDFSNIMSGIHSLSEAFQAEMDPNHPFQEGLALIQRNSRQASQLIHRILSLHRGKTGERNYYNLNELVADTTELLRKMVPRRIDIHAECAPQTLPLYVDEIEFQQVFFNLALNAVEAMPKGGRLSIVTSRHATIPPLGRAQGQAPRPPAVCLTVRDQGVGISARHLDAIFDPFFTTKSANKGSGLGLYNARLFVEKHHGAISVESAENQGSAFHVWLPEADFTEAERSETAPTKRRHTILLVASPGQSVAPTAESLRQNGLYVVTAESGAGAGELLGSPDYQFAAVFLVAGPGAEVCAPLLAEVKQRALPIKTILQVTGCNQDEIDTNLLGQADLILSPDTSSHEALGRVRSLLDDNPDAPL